ncbi:hypothetical protein N9B79_01560, partial [bacterium]|nr:hypothetical protein [bacterium]
MNGVISSSFRTEPFLLSNVHFFGVFMMRFTLSVLYLAIAAAIPAFAQQAAVPKQTPVVENCVVQYINKVDVPARAEGSLTEMRVDEGVTVAKDYVLAVIDDTAA